MDSGFESMYEEEGDKGSSPPGDGSNPPNGGEDTGDNNKPGDSGGNEPPAGSDKGDPTPPVIISVLESFLSDFDIKDGKITLDDNTEVVFSELSPEQQLEVLRNVSKNNRPSIEQEYELSENEIDVLNLMRKSGKSFDDIVNEIFKERYQEMQLNQKFGSAVDYKTMLGDDVYKQYLKEQNPDITDEDIEEDLKLAKETQGYDKTVNFLRNKYSLEQDAARNEWIQSQREKSTTELEEIRSKIVDVVVDKTDVAGWEVSDDVKNEILADLLEVDDNNVSPFMKELQTNPEKLFEAAWFLKYGEAYFNQIDTYYKNKIKALEAQKSQPAKPVVPPVPAQGQRFNRNDGGVGIKKEQNNPNVRTLDDLYEE